MAIHCGLLNLSDLVFQVSLEIAFDNLIGDCVWFQIHDVIISDF